MICFRSYVYRNHAFCLYTFTFNVRREHHIQENSSFANSRGNPQTSERPIGRWKNQGHLDF